MFDVRKLSKEELLEIVNSRSFDAEEYRKLVAKFCSETLVIDKKPVNDVTETVNVVAEKRVRKKCVKVGVFKEAFERWVASEIGDPETHAWVVKASQRRFGMAVAAVGIKKHRFGSGYRYMCQMPSKAAK